MSNILLSTVKQCGTRARLILVTPQSQHSLDLVLHIHTSALFLMVIFNITIKSSDSTILMNFI